MIPTDNGLYAFVNYDGNYIFKEVKDSQLDGSINPSLNIKGKFKKEVKDPNKLSSAGMVKLEDEKWTVADWFLIEYFDKVKDKAATGTKDVNYFKTIWTTRTTNAR